MVQYVITNGKEYLRNESGKLVPVRDILLSEKFDSLYKATRVLNSSINKKKRKNYKVKEIDDSNIQKRVDEKPDVKVINEIISATVTEADILGLANQLTEMRDGIVNVENRREELIVAVSDIDKQLTDIRHFIEFNDFETSIEHDVFRLEKAKYSERRAIKDELHIINALLDGKIKSIHVDEVLEVVNKMNERIYTPRVLTELFARDGVKVNKKYF